MVVIASLLLGYLLVGTISLGVIWGRYDNMKSRFDLDLYVEWLPCYEYDYSKYFACITNGRLFIVGSLVATGKSSIIPSSLQDYVLRIQNDLTW